MGFHHSEPRRAGGDRGSGNVLAGQRDNSQDSATSADKQAERPLISKYGTRHSEAILRNWSPAALAALGIRRDGGGAP